MPPNPPDAQKEEIFQRLKSAVLDKKPILKEILQKRGAKTLYEYARDYIDVNLVPPISARQDEFLAVFQREAEHRLGKDAAHRAAVQLKKYYYVSTADHHGPLGHPFFLTSNLLAALTLREVGDPLLNNVIVFPCANVSFDNSSFPRGLLFTSYKDHKIEMHKLPFFPAHMRQCPVFRYPAYPSEGIKKIKGFLKEKEREQYLSSEKAVYFYSLIDEIYANPDVLSSATYSEQITKTNYFLWKKLFSGQNFEAPNLIYLEQETLVNQLLLDYHIDGDSTLHHILFDPEYDPLIQHYFNGITAGFTLENRIGTYLFWALPRGAKYRMQMWKQGNELVSADGTYRVELRPDIFREKLEQQELIPSTLMCALVLALYYGLKLLGGFSQVNYLTFMKNAYIKMQTDRGNYRSVEVCAHAQTKEICGDICLAFLGMPDGSMTPATSLDLLLYEHQHALSDFRDMARVITLEEAVNSLMPEFYRIVYPEGHPERSDLLLNITSSDIARLQELDKKIKPCVTVSV